MARVCTIVIPSSVSEDPIVSRIDMKMCLVLKRYNKVKLLEIGNAEVDSSRIIPSTQP